MKKLYDRVVQHDGGWAYKLDDVFSEPFPTHKAAVNAAHRVAREQHVPGETVTIEYQNQSGEWITEVAQSTDRPDADVID
jgi:hypothetical protein